MFERYTEKARRVIFFARYEASQFGAPAIEPEHLLLGLMREDKTLTGRFFPRAQITIEAIRREIESRTLLRERIPTSVELPLAPETKRVLHYSHEESDRLQHRHIGTEHLLLGLLREERSMAAQILFDRGLRLAAVRDEIARQTGADARQRKDIPHLLEFSRDLTEDAHNDRLDPLIGRDPEIERLIQILCRRTKNNPVLIGEPGVGKTAIVEGLAQRIVAGEVPSFLENKRILSLDISLIVAGTKYRGQFEERLKQIMRELIDNPQYIVFIDELHTLVGAGSAEGSLDAANILKPALSRGEIQCIGATTPAEFRKSIEKDRSLERRFQAVKVPPPSEDEAVAILGGVRERYESFHQVHYTDEALEAAVRQSTRYIPDRFLPDKAIDVIDEAGARVKLRVRAEQGNLDALMAPLSEWERATYGRAQAPITDDQEDEDQIVMGEVTRTDVEEVIARWTGIPIVSLKEEESKKLLRIEAELHKRVISQRPAISALARAIRRSRAGLKNPHRPVGSFLFLGPTGVGKTEVARCLAEFLFGSNRSMIRFDMSEFMEKHAVSKLIGSPPGYVGHEEGGQLTERIKRSPYSVLLFDEIEKAHPDLFNILLQVFEDGILTDGLGNTVDFKNTIIIMTSNIGARFIQRRGTMGFQGSSDVSRVKMEEMVMNAVRQTFNPEFINRLDEIIVFDELGDEELLDVLQLQVDQINATMSNHGFIVRLADDAKRWVVQKTCADRSYGARPLRRALQKYVEDPLSEALIQGQLAEATLVEMFVEGEQLNFRSISIDDNGIEQASDLLVTP
ncbi:MAG TPA: ATP-dependent Clp protease ATP-binding subunit [Pyrinomonadaceae bacterium]|jgi:ATP-dependent Clp protease ATP-binding subunit ClpC|nr:ATP-dependent Clp protease ATP-binding subunit [Pyrinomonadaceae bacterium]